MTQSARKLVGTLLIILTLVAYPLLGVAVFAWLFATLPVWAQLVYFAIAGLGWALPAGVIIRWMARPDPVR